MTRAEHNENASGLDDRGVIFVMVSTKASVGYTAAALASFTRNTALRADDAFLLLGNEPGALPDLANLGLGGSAFRVVAHETPRGFAANVNLGLALARERGAGIVLLNNDVVFTPGWLPPLLARTDAISLAVGNQQYQYAQGGLELRYFMEWPDFAGRFAALDEIAQRHAAGAGARGRAPEALMPLFCAHIPHAIHARIGDFDERFGVGGGEDVDYRIRALLAGFDVVYAPASYVLHFMGKSTWRGAENAEATAERDAAYRARFAAKWGTAMRDIFLSGGDPQEAAQRLGVADSISAGDFRHVAQTCLARDSRTVQQTLRGAPAAEHRRAGKARPRICLAMIVKNEAPVIRRCLDSVCPLIDYAIVVDTGSTDDTQQILRAFFAEVPGELHERQWVDFAHNRNQALALARDKADYTLIIDADDTLEFAPDFALPDLVHDSYLLRIADASISYERIQLVSNAIPWRYEGVLHEFLTSDGAKTQGTLVGVTMRRNHDGARRRDPETYRRDAAILEQALESETREFFRARYTFYLAQSWRDCGEREKALEQYLRRAELGHWDQEVYVALYNAGQLQEALGRPAEEVLASYRRAIAVCPWRAEAYHGAARYLRLQNRFAEGYDIAKPGLHLEPPKGGLFVSSWIYRFGLWDEFSINAYYAGHYAESLRACERILALDDLPAGDRGRIEQNADFARRKLHDSAAAAASPGGSYPISAWVPQTAQGGTEIMIAGLRERLGAALDAIDLRINLFSADAPNDKPLVLWMHHHIDQRAVQWCRDASLVARVHSFVFVSHWQLERYVREFALPPQRCVVLKNATAIEQPLRPWAADKVRRVAYTSTPFRGLAVLLDAWERLRPENAELHIWSSNRLYGGATVEQGYEDLFERAAALPGAFHRGIVPNAELRRELRGMDYLAYPSTFAETSCLSAIEAMAAGCRVICPALGALPETTAGFARIYPWNPAPRAHAEAFAAVLDDELRNPWGGRTELAWAEQVYCHMFYEWSVRVPEWRSLIAAVAPPSSH